MKITVEVDETAVSQYGEEPTEGLVKGLVEDILERYFHGEYFDSETIGYIKQDIEDGE